MWFTFFWIYVYVKYTFNLHHLLKSIETNWIRNQTFKLLYPSVKKLPYFQKEIFKLKQLVLPKMLLKYLN